MNKGEYGLLRLKIVIDTGITQVVEKRKPVKLRIINRRLIRIIPDALFCTIDSIYNISDVGSFNLY